MENPGAPNIDKPSELSTYREHDFKLEKDLKLAGRGRPKGLPKTGGRKKGSIDKLKREAEIAASGLTPLDYMLGIVRAETLAGLDASVAIARETLRFEAAKAAAPYCHPRLQAVTLGGDPENPIKVDSMSELEAVRRLAFLLTKGTADAA
jgi:hypothetical protein